MCFRRSLLVLSALLGRNIGWITLGRVAAIRRFVSGNLFDVSLSLWVLSFAFS